MKQETQTAVLYRLEQDYQFKLGTSGNTIRGKCPACGQKEAWTYREEPWVIFCPRRNKCGETFYIRDMYPDLFENWEKRYQSTSENPTATVDAYLTEGRGFPIDKIKLLKGLYSQEYYRDGKQNVGSVTIRFAITDSDDPQQHGWWQRILDTHGTLPKTINKPKWEVKGHSWFPPNQNLIDSKEIWITEGIFDTIALWLSGIVSITALSCNNYPKIILDKIAQQCEATKKPRPKLIWAFDADPSGRDQTPVMIDHAVADGWECAAAQPPSGRQKIDWNDLYQRNRLSLDDTETYRYYGDLLTAKSARQKAAIIYRRKNQKIFPFDYRNATYWCKFDYEKYEAIMVGERAFKAPDNQDWLEEEKQNFADEIIQECVEITEIMDCKPTALYWQNNEETDEQWYYFNIDFPRKKKSVKNTFTGAQLSSAAEFKKRLLSIAPGVVYTGTSAQLDQLLKRWTRDIRRVHIINYIGYVQEQQAYIFSDVAVQNGKVIKINAEDYFELTRHINIKARAPFNVAISDKNNYTEQWIEDLYDAYKLNGLIALTAFFGSLFAQQIRDIHKSFPFLEIVGDPGTGKTTLIKFLWKLLGRENYEGEDPNKTTLSGLTRTFRQVSNFPVLLVESDREGGERGYAKQFNWDTIKTLYDGGSLGAQGIKNQGNETYNPPFKGTVIISQNAEVTASQPIMERIVHVGFKKSDIDKKTLAASRRLSKYEIQQLSHFTVQMLSKEKQIIADYNLYFDKYDRELQQDHWDINNFRIIHNYAQIKALFDVLCDHIRLDPNIQSEVQDELTRLAVQRDKQLRSDSQIVSNFWDTYEQIEACKTYMEDSLLNHHKKQDQYIAINFAHLYKVAADYRFTLPDMQTLQDALRHSQHYRFIEANKALASALQGKTVRCWIFAKPKNNA